MFAIICRRRLRPGLNYCDLVGQQFWGHQNPVLLKSFTSSVCENASEKTFTVSYLINSCGLSSNDAIIASKNLCFKSPENPDSVLDLLRKYGFTNAHIPTLIIRRPHILSSCPNRTLLPKLDFFRSIGVSLPLLAQKITLCPAILGRSLKNSLIPSYNDLKTLLRSDERVVVVFSRAPRAFGWRSTKGIFYNIAMLRERGVPESSIVSMVMHQPSFLMIGNREKLAAHVDRAVEMGFDITKCAFVQAMRVLVEVSESNMKRKMEVYRRCGWSESDIEDAFLRHPMCFKLSEKKIVAVMDFLVHEFGCEPVVIAKCPVLVTYSLEKRIKPRCLVARILNEKGLKNMRSVTSLLVLSEEKFLEKYIDKYKKEIPELSDIYQGKLSPSNIGFIREV